MVALLAVNAGSSSPERAGASPGAIGNPVFSGVVERIGAAEGGLALDVGADGAETREGTRAVGCRTCACLDRKTIVLTFTP